MEISYNLRYKKSNFSNRVIVDKDGEVIIYGKGFRLKGKGAGDKGELINFSEIKEFYYRDNKVIFITFNKEKYILSDSSNLFDQFLIDLYKARNEFLMDALFMKAGKMKGEYEGHFDRISKFGKPISKGRARIRLYQKSMIVIPEIQDAFVIHYDFVNFHEFDEMEYQLKITMDDGNVLVVSQLGNDYEFFEEKMNEVLGGMYESIINESLKEAFCDFHAGTLLKLAYLMKSGKAVSLKDIQKSDAELAERVEEFVMEKNDDYAERIDHLKDGLDEYSVYYGITREDVANDGFTKWMLFAMPEKNLVAFCIFPRWEQGGALEVFFYRIIMEKGIASEKIEDKVKEINQALLTLKFVTDPCYKDKRDLKHSPYQYAIRKLPFLRILRKSFVGVAKNPDLSVWKGEIKDIEKKSSLKK